MFTIISLMFRYPYMMTMYLAKSFLFRKFSQRRFKMEVLIHNL